MTGHSFPTASGHRMHYVDEGPRDGAPVLFVHGNPSWSYMWRQPIAALKDRYRCIAPDHLGMGLSDKPQDHPYVLPRRVRELGDLIDHLEPERPLTIVAHDWGGMIACAWAVANPARVAQLMLSNTAAFHLPPGRAFPWQLRQARCPLTGSVLVRGLNGFSRYAVRHCVRRRPLPPEVAAQYLAPYANWDDRVAVQAFVDDIPLIPQHQWYDYVSQVDAGLHRLRGKPLLLGWGLADFVFDQAFLAAWQERFPDARVTAWADGGHWVWEDYGDELTALLAEFLRPAAGA